MANYFVVIGKEAYPSDAKEGTAPKASTKVLEGLSSARVTKIEAASVAEAQEVVKLAYPQWVLQTPIVVTEAQWKES